VVLSRNSNVTTVLRMIYQSLGKSTSRFSIIFFCHFSRIICPNAQIPEYDARNSEKPAPKLSKVRRVLYTVFMPLTRDRGKILEESLLAISHARGVNCRNLL